jgi:hypothetical protein
MRRLRIRAVSAPASVIRALTLGLWGGSVMMGRLQFPGGGRRIISVGDADTARSNSVEHYGLSRGERVRCHWRRFIEQCNPVEPATRKVSSCNQATLSSDDITAMKRPNVSNASRTPASVHVVFWRLVS